MLNESVHVRDSVRAIQSEFTIQNSAFLERFFPAAITRRIASTS